MMTIATIRVPKRAMGFLRRAARFTVVEPCRGGDAFLPVGIRVPVPGRDSGLRLRDDCGLPPTLVLGVAAAGFACLLPWRGCSGANVPLLTGFWGRLPLARVE